MAQQVPFQVKITVGGRIVDSEDEALSTLLRVWPQLELVELMEHWADGTWLLELPVQDGDLDTLESLDITINGDIKIRAERDDI